MRTYTEEQRQNHLRLQREWYHRNKEKVNQYKREYYLKNKPKIAVKNKKYKEKLKSSDEVKINNERVKVKIPLFKILDVLRKHKGHYLHQVEVINWKVNDLNEFNKLMNG